uniref:Uncharacterized protein n=1 Tax=Candidatus Kentrum sp. DK TaxID=2126562 RepID=A0A450T989_9GAMM|nr:MAG: hypothetical protein BECKDK2373B_GA0170837_11232 [Candidatus Kentron sp. DK]
MELYAKVASHPLTALKTSSKCSFIPYKLRFLVSFRLVMKHDPCFCMRLYGLYFSIKQPRYLNHAKSHFSNFRQHFLRATLDNFVWKNNERPFFPISLFPYRLYLF